MKRLVACLLLLIATPTFAQMHVHKSAPHAEARQRSIKALSEAQVADLQAGKGMGLALAAELNGYPGPLHVLEHAQALHLSPAQEQRLRDLREAMTKEAVAEGQKLIELEKKLDAAFASRQISEPVLAQLVADIGSSQAALRTVHLKYHLVTATLLDPHQLHRYAELRGYR